MPEKYNTTWCSSESEFPSIGVECPKCQEATIEQSQFGGVWCRGCKWNWKISKFPPKETKPKVNEGTVMIMDELKYINKRLDDMAEYLEKKLGGKEGYNPGGDEKIRV